MIILDKISLQRGTYTLFSKACLTINPKEKVGLVGKNGCGKSTLLAILQRKLDTDQGDVHIPPQWQMAHLAQETPPLAMPALEYVIDGDKELRQIEQQLAITEEGDQIARLHARLDTINGYSAKARAGQLLYGLGFKTEEHLQPVANFSGGWRMRLNLAQALMCPSDVLLLDEPTNHLDLDALLWLENWLKTYPGTLLLISHDRDFLDKTVNVIVHVNEHQLTRYSGNYSAFENKRYEQLSQQQAYYEKQQQQIAHLQQFIDRFKAKASKARQAQSRIKALEKMELMSAVHLDSPLDFNFFKPSVCPNPLITLSDVSIGYGTQIILNKINISITPGDRIGLLGPNGAGKSTFIKTLAQAIPVIRGQCEFSEGLTIGYFAQHQIEQLYLEQTPLEHLQAIAKGAPDLTLRKFLGSFDFGGDKATTPITHFSGGEKSRLALALLVWKKPNLLLLDEPTNHLDLETRHALTLALQNFTGAIIIISHDRHLLRTATDSLWLIANQKLTVFDEDIDYYQSWLQEHQRNPLITKEKEPLKENAYQQQKTQRAAKAKINKLEQQLTTIAAELTRIHQALEDPTTYDMANQQQLDMFLKKQQMLKADQEQLEMIWLELMEQLSS